MIKVSVKLFATLRDSVGQDECEIILNDGSTTSMVMEKMIERYPQIQQWVNIVRLAVNYEYINDAVQLHDGDEVAIIPPVSGG